MKAASLSDLPEGAARGVSVGGRKLALCRAGGQVHALDDACPHRGGSLGGGKLENGRLECPLHGWRFSVADGACETVPSMKVAAYRVAVEGEDVLVEFDAPAGTPAP